MKVTGQYMTSVCLSLAAFECLVDIFDSSSVANSDLKIEINFLDDSLVDISFSPTQTDTWVLTVDSNYDWSYEITANATFNFLADFRNLDESGPRPNLRKVSGRPVVGSTPMIEIEMSSHEWSRIDDLDYVHYVATNATSLNRFAISDFDNLYEKDVIIVKTDDFPIPDEPFYVVLEGRTSEGANFDANFRPLSNLHRHLWRSLRIRPIWKPSQGRM